MSACHICPSKVHSKDEECPLTASILCRRCHNRGHWTSDCTQSWHEVPTCLEEMIPWDERQRWGVTSRTPFTPVLARGSEETERELDDINRVIVPTTFKELTALLEKYNIKVEKVTKPSEESCMKALRKWAVANGKRLVKEIEVTL